MTEIHRIEVPLPFPIKRVNCYYIRDSSPTLIDTGINSEQDFEAIAGALAGLGDSVRNLRRIIATHGHGDHAGLAGRLARESGAEVFVHPWDRPRWPSPNHAAAQDLAESFSRFLAAAGVPPQLASELVQLMTARLEGMFSAVEACTPLAHGQIFSFDDFELQVLHTPGHSPGSVCLCNGTDGELFSGDALLEEITYNPALEVGRVPEEYRSVHAYHETLNLLDDTRIRTVFPGHGAPFSDHGRRIAAFRRFHGLRRDRILALLWEADRGLTVFDVAIRLFPAASGLEVYYRVCAVHVHLAVLADEGSVACDATAYPTVFTLTGKGALQ
ncbi:MAG: MBL fold metallo-hydrolase [Thermodesulfobacteriota bacterium]